MQKKTPSELTPLPLFPFQITNKVSNSSGNIRRDKPIIADSFIESNLVFFSLINQIHLNRSKKAQTESKIKYRGSSSFV